jgi:hypothetical protein
LAFRLAVPLALLYRARSVETVILGNHAVVFGNGFVGRHAVALAALVSVLAPQGRIIAPDQ